MCVSVSTSYKYIVCCYWYLQNYFSFCSWLSGAAVAEH